MNNAAIYQLNSIKKKIEMKETGSKNQGTRRTNEREENRREEEKGFKCSVY